MGKIANWSLVVGLGLVALACSKAPASMKDAGGGAGGDESGAGGSAGGGAGAGGSASGGGGAGGSVAGTGGGGASGGGGAGGSVAGTGGDGNADGGSDVHPCGASAIADSICDFSSTQGQSGWSYGFIEPAGSNTFTEMTQYKDDESRWYTASGPYWTHISAQAAHPNGTTTSGGKTMVVQWAVRRWVSTVSQPVKISVTVFKLHTSASNGILARVLVDGVEIWSQRLLADDAIGVRQTLAATLNVGSTIDLALDPFEGEDLNDETYFSATISR